MAYEKIVQAINDGKINDVRKAFARNPLMKEAIHSGNNLLHKVVLAFSEASDDKICQNLVEIAQYLVEQGVDTGFKNPNDKTPLQLAEEKKITGALIAELEKPTVQLKRLPVSPELRKPGGAEILNNMVKEIEGQPSPWRWLPLVVMALIGGAVALLTNFGVISINATPITALFSSMGVSLGTGALGTALAAAGVVLLPALVAYGLMYALDRWVVPQGWHLKMGLLAGRMSSVLGVAVVAALVLASAPVTWPVLLAIGVAVPLAAMFLGWGVSSAPRRAFRQGRSHDGLGVGVRSASKKGLLSEVRPLSTDVARVDVDHAMGEGHESGTPLEVQSSRGDGARDHVGDGMGKGHESGTPLEVQSSRGDGARDHVGDGMGKGHESGAPLGRGAAGAATGRNDGAHENELENWVQAVTVGQMKDRTAACFGAIRLKQLDDSITMQVVKAFQKSGGDLGAVDESKEVNLLFAAVLAGKKKVVSYLTDVVDAFQFHRPHGFAQETPLMAAAQSGDQEMVAFLLPQSDPTLQYNDAGSAWDMVEGDHAIEIKNMFVTNVKERLDRMSQTNKNEYVKLHDESVRRWCQSEAFTAIDREGRKCLLKQAALNELNDMVKTMLEHDPDRDDMDYQLELFRMAWHQKNVVWSNCLQAYFLNNPDKKKMDGYGALLLHLFKIAYEIEYVRAVGILIDCYLSTIDIRTVSIDEHGLSSFCIDADWLQFAELSPLNKLKLAFLLLDPPLVEQLKQHAVIDSKTLSAVAHLATKRQYEGRDEDAKDCILWLLKDRDNTLKGWPQEVVRRSKLSNPGNRGVPSVFGLHARSDSPEVSSGGTRKNDHGVADGPGQAGGHS